MVREKQPHAIGIFKKKERERERSEEYVVLRGAIVECLPSEQQEPAGLALQRCNGGFQESDLQSDYQQLEVLLFRLGGHQKAPSGGRAANIDKHIRRPGGTVLPGCLRVRIQGLMSSQPLNHRSVKKSKEDTIPGSPSSVPHC